MNRNAIVDEELTADAGLGVAVSTALECAITTALSTAAAGPLTGRGRTHADAFTGVTLDLGPPGVQGIAGAGLGLRATASARRTGASSSPPASPAAARRRSTTRPPDPLGSAAGTAARRG